MSRYLYDIECDGLLLDCTRMWIMVIQDLDTGEVFEYLEGDLSWKEKLDNATMVAGHNIMGYDNKVLWKLFRYKFPKQVKFVDTFLLSIILDYKRFPSEQHGLAAWGEFFDDHKVEHEDWSRYSEEMRIRCVQDVKLNVKALKWLTNEYNTLKRKNPMIETYVRAEHAVADWCATAELEGWPFDKEAAVELEKVLFEEMQKVEGLLQSKLGYKVVPVDKEGGVAVPKRMRYNKDGRYESRMAAWFGVDPIEGLAEPHERTIDFLGEFSRIKIEPLKLSSPADVKIFLFRNGWVPTEWNYKKDPETGRRTNEKSSPKITEDSLEILGGDGKLYPEYLTAKSRHGILKTWIEEVDENGNLHGSCMTIGTPSMRSRHKIIVNVPSADSPWGPEMRKLFRAKPGWKLVGCDSAGNQARGLAFYLNNADFTDTLLNGDIHQFNADVLTEVLQEMLHERDVAGKLVYPGLREIFGEDFKVPRPPAKRILYAFLFGAGGDRLWSYIFGSMRKIFGNRMKLGFTRAVPGFDKLLRNLETVYEASRKSSEFRMTQRPTSRIGSGKPDFSNSRKPSEYGYIYSWVGNKIYVDSLHKLLVYLLQSLEKITCAAATMLLMEYLEEAEIEYVPLIMYHDEVDFMTPEADAERAAELGKKAFAEAPKLFGINIMDGSGKVGDSWYEVH